MYYDSIQILLLQTTFNLIKTTQIQGSWCMEKVQAICLNPMIFFF